MKKQMRKLSIGIVLMLAVGFYAMQESQNVETGLTTAPFEVITTGMTEDVTCDMPPIVATGQNGPQDCFNLGDYVDFISATSQAYVAGNIDWTSTPTLPGFDGLSGSRILRTYYIDPFTVTPGCYTIRATSLSFPDCYEEVTIRIKEFASDLCTECAAGPGGPGL